MHAGNLEFLKMCLATAFWFSYKYFGIPVRGCRKCVGLLFVVTFW